MVQGESKSGKAIRNLKSTVAKETQSEDSPKKRTCKRKHLEQRGAESEEQGVPETSKKSKEEENQRIKSSRKKITNKKYTDPNWSYLVDQSIKHGGQTDRERNETDQDKKRTEREDDKPP